MKLTFLSVELRNFLSYGNTITKFDLNGKGLTQIAGKNGVGKSATFDALSFCLFGRPYRKVKKEELINRINNKDTWTKVTFLQNTTKYIITRSLKPWTIKIEKWDDDTNEFIELELLSSVKLIQDEINKIIGIDYDTFRHIVFIAPSANNIKPFLTMSTWEKRTLIESLFNLEIISEMMQVVKKDKTENSHKLTTAQSNKELLTKMTKQTLEQYKNSKTAIEDFETVKASKIELINDKIGSTKEKIETKIKQMSDLDKASSKINKEELNIQIDSAKKAIATMRQEIGVCSAEMSRSKKIIKELNTNDICPSCNTTITPEHKEMEITNFTNVLNTNTTISKEHKSNIKTQDQVVSTNEQSLQTLRAVERNIEKIESEIKNFQDDVDKLNHDLKSVEVEKLNLNMDNIMENIKHNKEQFESITKQTIEYSDKVVLYDTAQIMLSDTGIKTEFYSSIVPLFNKTINGYITKFDLPISINFDNDFNVNIKSITSTDSNLNYYSFSEGEKKRIEISILLSFIKLSKTVANWSTSLLGLDETLDSGIDAEGMTVMLEAIKEISNDEDLNIIVVTHKPIDTDIFDRKLIITKDSLFSKIIEV